MKKLLFFALALLLAACEKPVFNETTGKMIPSETNVILHFTQYQQEAFTRSATDITNLCSRLNIAIFDAEGTKVKTYYGTLVVTDALQSYDLTLTRAVAMFRLVLTDESVPSKVAKLKFYYLGGSSTFSPKDGYGCVNSKQTEIRPVPADFVSGTAFEVYTLPHTEEDVLTKLTVTALDANDNILKERTFENIPITRNQVTRYTGSFFGSGGGGATGSGDFRMTADPDWDAVNGYTF